MWLFYILLSTIAWAGVNVLNSVLVHHHHKSPVILSWIQSILSMPVLLVLFFAIETQTSWALPLFVTGMSAYIADLWFFHAADKIDISVLNVAWSILSLFLTVIGVFYFHETWSIHQSFGAILIIIGSLLLTFFHKHINLHRTLWLVTVLALLYVPFYSIKKVAINSNVSAFSAFFWLTIGRETPSFVLPMLSRNVFKKAMTAITSNYLFCLKSLIIIFFYFLAELLGAYAYQYGPLSLVAITSNTQPFFVIIGAWMCMLFWPAFAPKELLTRQSLKVKTASFCLVFAGLLLMPPQ